MFTGLVQAVGRVAGLEAIPAGRSLVVDAGTGGEWALEPAVGDSISVSGCCLTLASAVERTAGGRRLLTFHVVPETLAKTTLGGLVKGSAVNLEGSCTPTTLLGGHLVQGHVDGVGRVVSVQTQGEWRVRIMPPAGVMKFIAPKGSVCVEGVSLTVAGLEAGDAAGEGGWFEVALIPTTLEKTTLRSLRAGDGVNIEADAIAKTVVHYLEHYAGRLGGPASGEGR